MKFFFICIFLGFLTSCSFSKEKKEQEVVTSAALKQITENRLKNTVYLDSESALKQIQASNISELNATWSNGDNFLNYLINFGSPDLLRESLKSGLSVFLPSQLQEETSFSLKKQLLQKYGSTTMAMIPDSINAEKSQILQAYFDGVISEIYEEIRNDRTSSAQEIYYKRGGTCDLVMIGMLAKYQIDSSVPLSKVKDFFRKVSCDLKGIGIDEKLYFWKSELQKQFKLKFENLDLLEELTKLEKMPYLISVSSSKYMVGLKTLIDISKSCRIEDEATHTTDCKGSANEEDLDAIVYGKLHFSIQAVDRYLEDNKYRDLMGYFTTDALYPVYVAYTPFDGSRATDSDLVPTEVDILSFEQGIFRLFYHGKFEHKILIPNTNESDVSKEGA